MKSKNKNLDEPQLFAELYGKYVQMDDRFESIHIWNKELALKNNGKWTPIKISKAVYNAEMKHFWNNEFIGE